MGGKWVGWEEVDRRVWYRSIGSESLIAVLASYLVSGMGRMLGDVVEDEMAIERDVGI